MATLLARLAARARPPTRRRKVPRKAGQAGFTLLEVMVVVVILGILAALVVPRVMDRPEEARATAAKQDIRAIENALDLYRLDNHGYPPEDIGLQALVEDPGDDIAPNWSDGGYLDGVPEDPWGDAYQYRKPGEHGEIDVYSLGGEGSPGNPDPDAVIGNWELE